MRQRPLVAKHRHRRVKTTDSRHQLPVAPNRLNRDFSAERPNEKWVANFTYIDTTEGWLYLALSQSSKVVQRMAKIAGHEETNRLSPKQRAACRN